MVAASPSPHRLVIERPTSLTGSITFLLIAHLLNFVLETTFMLRSLTVAAALLAIVSTAAAQHADVILHNGKVLTVDDNFTIVQAVAITGNKISATGTNEAVLATAGFEAAFCLGFFFSPFSSGRSTVVSPLQPSLR